MAVGMRCPTCGDAMQRLADRTWACPTCQPGTLRRLPTPPRRRFLAVLVLSIVTLGFYFLYYNFVVFREMDQRAGRTHWGLVFAAGLGVMAAGVALALNGLDQRLVSWIGTGLFALYLHREVAAMGREARPFWPVVFRRFFLGARP